MATAGDEINKKTIYGAENRDPERATGSRSDVNQLLVRRRKYRTLAADSIALILGLIKTSPSDDDFESKALELKIRIKRLEFHQQRLREVQDGLEGCQYEGEIEADAYSENYDCHITMIIEKGRKRSDQFQRLQTMEIDQGEVETPQRQKQGVTIRPSTVLSTPGSNSSESTGSQYTSNRNLPKLDIQRYDGDLLMWPTFWARLQNDVDLNPTLNDGTKISYLYLALSERILKEIRPLGENYKLVVKYLSEQYGDPKQLSSLNTLALHDRQPLENAKDVDAMRDLCNFLKARITSLVDLGTAVETYYPLVTNLLPTKIFVKYQVEFPEEQDLDHLMLYFERIVKAMEVARNQRQRGRVVSTCEGKVIAGPSKRKPTAAVLSTSQVEEPSSRRSQENHSANKPCVLCQSSQHRSWNCDSDLTITERKDNLRSQGRCLVCFRQGHLAADCRTFFKNCRLCNNAHHVAALCPARVQNRGDISIPLVANVSAGRGQSRRYILKTLKILLQSGELRMTAVGLIDDGSQRTFVSRRVVQQLKWPKIGQERVTTSTFDGVRRTKTYDRVRITMMDSKNQEVQFIALVMDHGIHHEVPTCDENIKWLVEKMQKGGMVMAEQFNDIPTYEIDIIIGIDAYHLIMTGESCAITPVLTAFQTVFGWIVQGTLQSDNTTNQSVNCICSLISAEESGEEDDVDIRKLWSLDIIGIKDGGTTDEIEHSVNISFKPEIGRYEVSLPWNFQAKQQLADNRVVAVSRLFSLIRRLQREPGRLEEYDKAIHQYVIDNQAEEVPVEEYRFSQSTNCYYLPHKPVYSTTRSTKLRVVFDASSHQDNQLALNDCLTAGEDRTLDLVKYLLQFRQGRYAVTADLQKAFLQIEVDQEDRDYIRYLWIRMEEPRKIRVFRMKRVLFGLTTSPYLLKKVLLHHASVYQDRLPLAYSIVKDGTYVDDLIASFNDEEMREKTVLEVLQLMEKAGFSVHKIMLSEEDHDPVSVLGLWWDPKMDELSFQSYPKLEENHTWTKRTAVKIAASFFDPMGWAAPMTIQARMLIQRMWVEKYKWDDVLSDELQGQWERWLKQIEVTRTFSVARHFGGQIGDRTDNVSYEMHLFSDASPQAYGVVAYLVMRTTDGKTETKLIMSRFRVAPVKQLTLPRLELMAALVAVRLKEYLSEHLKYSINEYWFWTDSTIVLFWLKGLRYKYPTFVSNRVGEINQKSEYRQWRHCPSEENPADSATRLCKTIKIPNLETWWEGPSWLKTKQWPVDVDLLIGRSNADEEGSEYGRVAVMTMSTEVGQVEGIHQLIDISSTNDYKVLIRKTVDVIRVWYHWKHQPKSETEYRELAEGLRINSVQLTTYQHELKKLEQLKYKEQQYLVVQGMKLEMDGNRIVRLCSRLTGLDADEYYERPVLLPKQHLFTEMMVRFVHSEHHHAGTATTLSLIRQKYWIPQGRQLVCKLIKRCFICLRWSRQVERQPVANLPVFRSNWSALFIHVGVDFAGPVLLMENSIDGQRTIKAYIVLFTCAVTRGVHLEVSTSLSAVEFISALRRFMARRGVPVCIYSDNASTFRKTSRVLAQAKVLLTTTKIQTFLLEQGIRWNFIMERAPWWGGYWERIVRLVKDPLRRALGRRTLDYREFVTLLTEIEAIVNSRPLMVDHDDPEDPRPVTPALLMIGRSLQMVDWRSTLMQEGEEIWKTYRSRLTVGAQLQQRWKMNYITLLRSVHSVEERSRREMKVGQVYLLSDSQQKRALWPLV